MKTSISAFLLGFVVSVWLTPLARRLAVRFRLVDRPQDGRRVHQKATPRAGGVGIAAGVIAPILGLAFYDNAISRAIYGDLLAVAVLMVGALAALAVGLADDLARPSAKLRLLALTAIAAMTWAGGHRVDEVTLPWLGHISLGAWSLPVTVLWIVGVIVAFNFIDGLDGLASGIALISTLTLFVHALIDQNVLWMTWTGAMAGALLGFLVFNFNPASIFMGDAGSNFLGYLMAVVALQTARKEATAVSLAVPLCVLGLPLLDLSLTMFRRALLRQGLFASERGHLHHRLLNLGLTHKQAVLVLYGVTVVFCLGALSHQIPELNLEIVIAGLITVVIFVLMFVTGYLHPRDLVQMYRQGEANEARQRHLETTCLGLADWLQLAGPSALDLPRILEDLVEHTCVSGVQYRCEHAREVVVGDLDRSARGTRYVVHNDHGGAARVLVFWKDRSHDPSPREMSSFRKLFAALQCSCKPEEVLASPGNSGRDGPMLMEPHLAKIWAALVESAATLSVQRMQLEMKLPWLPEEFNETWEQAHFIDVGKCWRLDVPVIAGNRMLGWLKVIGDSTREDIARVLDVLETSESYLASVFRQSGKVAVPMSVS